MEDVKSAPVENVVSEEVTGELQQPSKEGVVAPRSMGQDAIPDLLKVGEIESNQLAHIDTEILEPVIFSESFIRFQLTNKGFLNPYSRLCFQLKNSNAGGNPTSVLPINVGVGSLFQRVILKVGGKTICEIDDFNHFYAYKSMFVAGELNKEREAFLTGRQMSHIQYYGKADGAAGADHIGNVSSRVGLETHKENFGADLEPSNYQKVNNDGVFSITLEDLLPVFRSTAMPLYMLAPDQAVQIELVMANELDRIALADGSAQGAGEITLDRTSCRMIADHTTYDQSSMDEYAAANPVLSWSYMDYQLSKTAYANPAAASNTIRNIGGAGRLVPRVFNGLSLNTASNANLLNKFEASALNASATEYGLLTTNIKKNDKFLYPIDRSSTPLHFHSVKDTEMFLPIVSRAEYSRQGNVTTGYGYMGRPQNAQVDGKFFWNAYKLNDGERVGSRGLELHNKYVTLPAGAYTGRCWIECIKVAVLENGRFDCYFA